MRITSALLAAMLLAATSCGGDSSGDLAATSASEASAPTSAPALDQAEEVDDSITEEAAAEEVVAEEAAAEEVVTEEAGGEEGETVVVVAEEPVLADLLALGIPVVASSATVPDVGFQGLDAFDTADIEIFNYLALSLEELATYEADRVVVWQFMVDRVGAEQLEGLGAELIVIPDGTSGPDRLRLFADAFDRGDRADALLTELDDAYSAAEALVPESCQASVMAVYAGPSVAAFARGVWDIPRAVERLGCDLVPGAEIETDGNGRAWLSLEQLDLFAAPTLIMMQTDAVDGERDSVTDVMANPLWPTLPAVQGSAVHELDRLGYPGIAGEIRLLADLVPALAP